MPASSRRSWKRRARKKDDEARTPGSVSRSAHRHRSPQRREEPKKTPPRRGERSISSNQLVRRRFSSRLPDTHPDHPEGEVVGFRNRSAQSWHPRCINRTNLYFAFKNNRLTAWRSALPGRCKEFRRGFRRDRSGGSRGVRCDAPERSLGSSKTIAWYLRPAPVRSVKNSDNGHARAGRTAGAPRGDGISWGTRAPPGGKRMGR